MTAVEQVLAVAGAEVGYLEKATNAQLDDKTANAGRNNFTKYARDLDRLGMYNTPKNGYAWCDIFVDWCFVRAFGLETALRMTGQALGGYGAGCGESVRYYKGIGRFYATGPRPGDQIFFTGGGGMAHTGLVERVSGSRVYTIEGNTSRAGGVVPNGGEVCRKSYPLDYTRIGGYGRPDFTLVKEEETMTGEEIYTALQAYLETRPLPDWAAEELREAVELGLTDGKDPMRLVPRYQAAIMAKRAIKGK